MPDQKLLQAEFAPPNTRHFFRLPARARSHAFMLSAATEIALTASTASATVIDVLLRPSVPLGEVAIAVALFFWLAAEIACLWAGPAVPLTQAHKVPLQTKTLDRAVRRRNRLIKRAAWISAAASAAYIIAGAALGSFSLIAGGGLYLAAAWVEYNFKQDEPVRSPRYKARSAKEWITSTKRLLQGNPAAISAVITLPALATFCAGLFQVLPAYLAALITTGHLVAALLWSAGIPQQKTFTEQAA